MISVQCCGCLHPLIFIFAPAFETGGESHHVCSTSAKELFPSEEKECLVAYFAYVCEYTLHSHLSTPHPESGESFQPHPLLPYPLGLYTQTLLTVFCA